MKTLITLLLALVLAAPLTTLAHKGSVGGLHNHEHRIRTHGKQINNHGKQIKNHESRIRNHGAAINGLRRQVERLEDALAESLSLQAFDATGAYIGPVTSITVGVHNGQSIAVYSVELGIEVIFAWGGQNQPGTTREYLQYEGLSHLPLYAPANCTGRIYAGAQDNFVGDIMESPFARYGVLYKDRVWTWDGTFETLDVGSWEDFQRSSTGTTYTCNDVSTRDAWMDRTVMPLTPEPWPYTMPVTVELR